MCFVQSNNFAVSDSEEEFILKNIFTEENLRKLMSSMSFKNVWAKALAKIYRDCLITFPRPAVPPVQEKLLHMNLSTPGHLSKKLLSDCGRGVK